jgi:hypothetical protein
MYYVCRSYKTEQWRGKNGCDIFLFHLSKCRVRASFTNDILRPEAETLASWQWDWRLQQRADGCVRLSLKQSFQCAPWQTLDQVVPGEQPLNWPTKSLAGICVHLWAVSENWLQWLVMNLCASLGCFWRLIEVVGNELVCISGHFLKIDCSGQQWICAHLGVVSEDWLQWSAMNLSASLGSFWWICRQRSKAPGLSFTHNDGWFDTAPMLEDWSLTKTHLPHFLKYCLAELLFKVAKSPNGFSTKSTCKNLLIATERWQAYGQSMMSSQSFW